MLEYRSSCPPTSPSPSFFFFVSASMPCICIRRRMTSSGWAEVCAAAPPAAPISNRATVPTGPTCASQRPLSVSYTMNSTPTYGNMATRVGPRPRYSPRTPEVRYTLESASGMERHWSGYSVSIVLTTSRGYTIEAATIPATPPAKSLAPAWSEGSDIVEARPIPARSIRRLTNSYTRNWVPRLGATLRQLAPLPLNIPLTPSFLHVLASSSVMDEHASPRHIMTVLTISMGAQHVRESMPAMAPA
mmetsp:Transcript_3331/g.8489  ORF Transcript_3331/g.8489 Transcript_3331/m.8489 type:complete len:246 (-) Transcript_3331:565-1302(-)